MRSALKAAWTIAAALGLIACAPIGPNFEQPDVEAGSAWSTSDPKTFSTLMATHATWWHVFGDAELDDLIALALKQNNTLEIAGLRVLEARTQLAIAVGNQYPQSQALSGSIAAVSASESAANTAFGDLSFEQYDVGVSIGWELDFWGRFRRAVESADAAYLGSIAAYDNAVVLLVALVAESYAIIRTLDAQLKVAQDNVALQQRSYDITNVLYKNGEQSELDVLQARTLLLSTQSSIPELQTSRAQAQNALSILLGVTPGEMRSFLSAGAAIPPVPQQIAVGIPADVIRQRPDVRLAEQRARALTAQVGFAEANLRPSFSLAGTLGLSSAGGTDTTRSGETGFDGLFDGDSVTYAVGPRFVWPLLNYGRLKNNVRLQDARLQQSLVAYRDAVLNAAREVEDSMAAVEGRGRQQAYLAETVAVAKRSSEVSLLRYREGFADYQRVLNAQQSLFNQQLRLVANQGALLRSVIDLYRALGGGWQSRVGQPMLDVDTQQQMRERVNWRGKLDPAQTR